MNNWKDINKLDNDDIGTFKVLTKSGSTYHIELTEDSKLLKRINKNAELEPLRRDEESIIIYKLNLEVGKSGVFILEPLGEKDYTQRTTTEITKILEKH